MEIRDLRQAIIDILLMSELSDVEMYYNHAKKDAVYPYIVWRIEDTYDTSPTYNHVVKFMIYDHRNKSSLVVGQLADTVQRLFNKKQYTTDKLGIHSVLSIRQSIPSEFLVDSQVEELQFDMTVYRKD